MTRQYKPSEYDILSARLTEQEINCIAHCQVHSDCAADGECSLQDKVTDIIATESEVTNESHTR